MGSSRDVRQHEAFDGDEKPYDVGGFRGVCVHPDQQILGGCTSATTTILDCSGELETRAFKSDSITLATAPHLLGVVVCCGQWICVCTRR